MTALPWAYSGFPNSNSRPTLQQWTLWAHQIAGASPLPDPPGEARGSGPYDAARHPFPIALAGVDADGATGGGAIPVSPAADHLKPSLERVRELLDYCPVTGEFKWRSSSGPRAVVGASAGGHDAFGYRRIKIDRRFYKAHRLAFLLTYGRWPECAIDHIDGNKANNRIENLREVNASQNMHNRAAKKNASGFPGIYRNGRKWTAQIDIDGKRYRLGTFEDPSQAAKVYLDAKRQLLPERGGQFRSGVHSVVSSSVCGWGNDLLHAEGDSA